MPGVWARLRSLAADRQLGARETARRAAELLGEVPEGGLNEAVGLLLRGHPSMGPLWRLAGAVLSSSDRPAAAGRFLEEMDRDSAAAAVLASSLPDSVLTISFSDAVRETVRVRRPRRVACMRSEPGREGLAMARSIEAWTEASVVDDEEALSSLPAEAVVVGADALTPSSVVNKVKTRALVEAARGRELPRYAVAGASKLVPVEVPAPSPFEATPLEWFTAVALPEGLLSPSEAAARARGVALPDEVVRLLRDV